MDRREFVKGAGGLVLVVAAGSVIGPGLVKTVTTLLSDGSPELCGPSLIGGIALTQTTQGVEAHMGSVHIFSADTQGEKFLRLADGTHTLEEIAHKTGMSHDPAAVARFFVTLGQAGYLENRVEVALIENRA